MTSDEDIRSDWKIMTDKINDFTTLLNKNNISYKVEYWDSAEGVSIKFDNSKVMIYFYVSGLVEFTTEDAEE